MEDIKSIIAKIKESITSSEESLAFIYAKIDSLECYPHNDKEIEELEMQSTDLEELIKEKKEQLELYSARFEEIKKVQEQIEKLKKERDFLQKQERNNGSDTSTVFGIGALDQTIKHLQGKLKHLSNLNNIK